MSDLTEVFRQYGKEKRLSPGEVLLRQGTVSDGVYYLKQGRLGAYREEQDAFYRLSEIAPGSLVGELGSATGWHRTATIRAEEVSLVVYISEDDFHRALDESPALAAAVVCQIGERLTGADLARVALDRSYQQTMGRVQELSTEKMRLEELLHLREELADMIVHDLRNPLGVIVGGLQLLERVPVAETELAYVTSVVEAMGHAAQRMQRLVDTLVDISCLEAGEMVPLTSPLDLSALADEVIAEERYLAEGKGITLESLLPADLPAALADRDILQRVLANLVDNALKFTPSRGRVWLEARPGAEEIRVEIVDTGPGIPPQERERIFEKFTQVRGQIGTRRGAGLGLTFCRMAVEAHGGRIWVEDGPGGKGSCFVFVLPRAQGNGGSGPSD